MPRSRRFRKGQSQSKPEWGKNNPQTKSKNRKATVVVGVIAVVAVVIAVFFVMFPNMLFSPSPSASPTPTPSPTATPVVTLPPGVYPAVAPALEYSEEGTIILLETSMGNIIVQMRDDKPTTTSNFINLVTQGLYDDTVFHRVIDGFMIQGGNTGTSVATIPDEIGSGNNNLNGTIAMAKTSEPNSATSQFFINVADNGNNIIDNDGTRFDTVYTVFGKVIGGMDVVMNISKVAVTTNQLGENSQTVDTVTLIRAAVVTH